MSVVCIDGVAREVTYSCPSCRLRRSLAASAESLSLLHHAGVRTVEQRSARDDELDSRSDDGEEKVTTARQVVSLKILLEQPDFLTRLDATPESTREVPPANPR